jgi:adenylosuccinate lyase
VGLREISPIDGRYKESIAELEDYFSEFALIKFRVRVEIEYLIALLEFLKIRELKSEEKDLLRKIHDEFSLKDAEEVKKIEKVTNHDIKAVEYFVKDRIEKTSLNDIKEIFHFGLTSDDVNNLACSLMLKECLSNIYLPTVEKVLEKIVELADKYKEIPMLSRTHGQPASPTTVGKELINFGMRLKERINKLRIAKLPGKLNSAVGNYNSLQVAYPQKDWIEFSNKFVSNFGLVPKILTTQIVPHEDISDLFNLMITINNIILNLDKDIWRYISDNYFSQKTIETEVGSSIMPHKVNPIDFENSEGNLEFANAILSLLSNRLEISRLQRDLSDSTVKRNYGVGFAHSILGYKSTLKGLNKISPNMEKIKQDLENNPEIISEAVQTILRRDGYEMPYEKLKDLMRGKKVTMKEIHEFISSLNVSKKVKKELLSLIPENYIGLAIKLTEIGIKKCRDKE